MQTKVTNVSKAYECSKVARYALIEAGARSMECTEDKAGIVWERFIIGPNGTSAILYATPDWWDVFVPLTVDMTIGGTIAAIKALAQPKAS